MTDNKNFEAVNSAFDAVCPGASGATEESMQTFITLFNNELNYGQGLSLKRASSYDIHLALSKTVRNYMAKRWNATNEDMTPTALGGEPKGDTRVVAYLSAEYLLGSQLQNAILTTGLEETIRASFKRISENTGIELNYEDIVAQEVEPGLGNGGLGRLAACFIDSLATLSIPAFGYGIRYEYGIFRQAFENGGQVEYPDNWLEFGDPWEVTHPEKYQLVGFGGHVENYVDHDGRNRKKWVPNWKVMAIPNDWMVPGYKTANVNTLRLWSARATQTFILSKFNVGDYIDAASEQVRAENISKVLYPEDSTLQGKELRLQQQYFFVAASIKDLLQNRFGRVEVTDENPSGIPWDADLSRIPELICFQLNDTHPVIGIPELLRILIDERGWEFEPAWDIVKRTFNYTCHTLLPEALEVWPADLLGSILPRHLELIKQINDVWLSEVRAQSKVENPRITPAQAENMSIIAGGSYSGSEAVQMAYLATVGSTRVNGVAELHSQLLKDETLKNFSDYTPDKFTNVTNGVTPRRFIRLADPKLCKLINDLLGHGWINNLDRLKELEQFVNDDSVLDRLLEVKQFNKVRLASLLQARDGINLNVDTMFDVMVKRLHEYKRQTLKILHIIALYAKVKNGTLNPEDIQHRTVIFGAKAAPGYRMAKEIIKLINAVGEKVRICPELQGRLDVQFPANYNVTLAQTLIPAANLSEQISLAGKEASGTGNMKFMHTGALTCGTLDGANVEMHERAGDENFYLFGMKVPDVEELLQRGYSPYSFYEQNQDLRDAIDLISSGEFSDGDGSTFSNLVHDLLNNDRFMVLADFDAYMQIQNTIENDYKNPRLWAKKSLMNIANSGYFSSDRSIQDYLDRIWHSSPLKVNVSGPYN
ncbi:MAG: glycogen/starch/alpha-glucan phosphorylase [Candidatus Ancillula sp.]|jgi:starch phosphorylase|nr:glycogen/starch/alpha-glucan phosphorylase [Candidatus Ancillula sp.]